jgi:hypothetical protein
VAPNEDREQSASRALLIALAISREWGGEPIVPPRPDLSPLLDDVLVEHYNSGMALYGVAEDLDEALIRLEQAFGVPREVTA